MESILGPLTPADVDSLARLHRVAFPGFFLSTLGEAFLIQFYKGFLADETAVSVVARGADGSVQGAAVGTTQPAGFFSRLIKHRWPGFLLASIGSITRNPKAARRLLRAVRYRGSTPSAEMALLSSICVDPAQQGSGVGRQLLEAWVAEVARRNVHIAFLTTDTDDNSASTNFYLAMGWVLFDHYITPEGRSMSRYTISLD